MALQAPFFGKRETDVFNPRHPNPSSPGAGTVTSSSAATSAPGASTKPAPAASSPSTPATPTAPPKESGSKLTVGPNIKLKGVEITDCDTLVVEGLVEATMDSRVIQIAEHGAFKGSAEIDIAEIHGAFDGELTVREKLVIYATGKVSGKIRYGRVVIEEGGQLAGEIQASGLQSRPAISVAA
ncbi:polymer-forming cytoskeletal protein [Ramlibacter sp. 2FC]|uniref:bactofilin family protein n=1 Tax=Ramlibacter sp. 2FC TaxID=2502188 RepID=UPI0010F79884|nr:polymer-forming cytoskeletal protein [Ramlibacter sp. 2FC]